jgi:UDPglucose 6-dehydrogenase
MRIGVIGTGYVGLVTGACFAEFGVSVTCVDTDAAKVESLRAGRVPFYEPGLSGLVTRHHADGRLSFTTDVAEGVKDADAVFIAVGTPPAEDGSANLSYVDAASREVARNLAGYTVVVVKSTVPVGTNDRLAGLIAEHLAPGAEFHVASNPEFLREGSAVGDFMNPDRVVIGTESGRAVDVLKKLYAPLVRRDVPFVVTDTRSAEIIKYASNCFLAAKVSFINEIANLCDRVGADVSTVARGMGLDDRIGPKFLKPGPGFGGSCFPKDLLALVDAAERAGTELRVVKAVVEANIAQHSWMVRRIEDAMGGLEGRVVCVLGLSYKPETDDVRESPALYIVAELVGKGARVRAYDPEAMENARRVLGEGVSMAPDAYAAASGAEALVVATEWDEFGSLDMPRVAMGMKGRFLFDLRNMYDPAAMRAAGLLYHGVGRR